MGTMDVVDEFYSLNSMLFLFRFRCWITESSWQWINFGPIVLSLVVGNDASV